MGIFSRPAREANSYGPSLILSNFKPIKDFIAALATCKNENDPIKTNGARVLTTLYIELSDA